MAPVRIHRGQDRALANEANTLVEMQPLTDKKSRSLACGTAVLRVGAAGAMLWLDLRGAVSLHVRIGDSAA